MERTDNNVRFNTPGTDQKWVTNQEKETRSGLRAGLEFAPHTRATLSR